MDFEDQIDLSEIDNRNEVKELVRLGIVTHIAAENWARKKALRPFSFMAPLSEFDPLTESHWSIEMCITWVAFRSPNAVRLAWDEFAAASTSWMPLFSAMAEGQARQQGYELRRMPIRYPSPRSAFLEAEDQIYSGVRSALMLRAALRRGEVFASARSGDGHRVQLSADFWIDHAMEEGFPEHRIILIRKASIYDPWDFSDSKDQCRVNDANLALVALPSHRLMELFPLEKRETPRPKLLNSQIEDILSRKIGANGGFLSQDAATELIRSIDPTVSRQTVRRIAKALTGNEKPGPKFPRKIPPADAP